MMTNRHVLLSEPRARDFMFVFAEALGSRSCSHHVHLCVLAYVAQMSCFIVRKRHRNQLKTPDCQTGLALHKEKQEWLRLLQVKINCGVCVAVLMQQIVKNAAETEQQQVFMILCHLAATQPQLRELPKSVAKVCLSGSVQTSTLHESTCIVTATDSRDCAAEC